MNIRVTETIVNEVFDRIKRIISCSPEEYKKELESLREFLVNNKEDENVSDAS